MKKITSIFITIILLFTCGCAPKTSGGKNNDIREVKYSIVNEQVKSVEGFSEEFGNSMYVYIDSLNAQYRRYVDFLKTLPIFLSEPETVYKKYTFNYESIDIDSSKITLSASLIVPFKNGEPCFHSLVIDNHATINDKYLAPTRCWDVFSLIATTGCAVLECDLIGAGVSEDKIIPFNCKHTSPQNTADAALCVIDFLEKEFSITTKDYDIFNVGYSQGAFNAMAFLEYIETVAPKNQKEKIKITKSYIGSGSYFPAFLFDDDFERYFAKNPEFLIMWLLAIINYRPEFFDGITIYDFLTDYGKQFIEPILNNSLAETEAVKAQVDLDGNHLLDDIHNVFVSEVFDKNSKITKSMLNAANAEALLNDGFIPTSELMLYYTLCDDLISPRCSIKARELFGERDNITYVVEEKYKNTTHVLGGVNFYLKIIDEMKAK